MSGGSSWQHRWIVKRCYGDSLGASVSPYCQLTGGDPHHPIRQMTKNQAISALILAEVAQGKTIQQAFDAVIGEGAYEQLAGELWEALQPQA